MRGNHFLETQSKASRNRADVHRRPTPPDQPRTRGDCTPSYEIRHWHFPDGGSSEIEVTYNAVTESISLGYAATAAEVKTAIDAHTQMVLAGVTCSTSSVPAGTLRRSSVLVVMPSGGTIGPGDDSGLTPNASTGYVPVQTVVICGGC